MGEEDLWGEAEGVTRCIRGAEMILNQRERLGGSHAPFFSDLLVNIQLTLHHFQRNLK